MRKALLMIALLILAAPLGAQDNRIPGVQLESRYTLSGQHALAVQPFTGGGTALQVALQVSQIIENDLRHSDRFRVLPVPEALASGAIDYAQWNSLNLTWLVTGAITPMANGFQAEITLHDAARGSVEMKQNFSLPAATSPDYRMAVHIVSDELVRRITGQPGAAATRIAFRRKNNTESFDLMVVDADGENLRRIFGSSMLLYSPAWSPDGRKLAYALRGTEGWRLVERDLASGQTRVIHSVPDLLFTPSYSPDGTKLAFATWLQGGAEIMEYDLTRNCCLRRLTDSPQDNMSPSYSPDGKTMVFHSTRTRSQHVYVMPATGGDATVLSPFGERVTYAAPEWSPIGSEVIFHAEFGGVKHLMLADATRFGAQILQLTSQGVNEDASWAPDGRHVVFTSSGLKGEGPGLYVLDKTTGNTRRVLSGRYLEMPDWSASFGGRVVASRE